MIKVTLRTGFSKVLHLLKQASCQKTNAMFSLSCGTCNIKYKMVFYVSKIIILRFDYCFQILTLLFGNSIIFLLL